MINRLPEKKRKKKEGKRKIRTEDESWIYLHKIESVLFVIVSALPVKIDQIDFNNLYIETNTSKSRFGETRRTTIMLHRT
jgi:hypothetical protein